MKTRIYFFSLMGILFFYYNGVKAATYYYNDSIKIQKNGYRYNCDKTIAGMVKLYNDSCKYAYSDLIYKNDSIVKDAKISEGDVMLVEKDGWSKRACDSIINSAFSPEEKQRFGKEKLRVSITINPDNGRIIEVYFSFYYSDPFGTIPVETYRNLELNLKRKVWLTATATGKKLKFIKLGWWHKVE